MFFLQLYMLKFNKTKIIWVVGSPRSGTTMLTDYIGKHTDFVYNEPWETHNVNDFFSWSFPDCNSIVFKYCSNWMLAKKIQKRFKNSFFVHVLRNPSDVVYSMMFPKKESEPQRNWSEYSYQKEQRFEKVINHWYSFVKGCFEIENFVKYKLFIYEKTPYEILDLNNFLNLNFKNDIFFKNCNLLDENLECLNDLWKKNSKVYLFKKEIEKKYYNK